MSAVTIVLLRHGRTAYNAEMRLQGQVDIPLDDVGRWQAEQGAKALALTHHADRVISSDLSRAVATATAYADLIGVPVETDPHLRERGFGQWEGLTRAEIVAGWPEEAEEWQRGGEFESVGAETKETVAERLYKAVAGAAQELDSGTLVVVSHGAAITLAITKLLGLEPVGWRGVGGLDNVHWSHLHRSAAGATPDWRLVAHNIGAGFPLDEWNEGPDWILSPTSA